MRVVGGLSGRLKSSSTPFQSAQWSRIFEVNSVPLSKLIRFGNPRDAPIAGSPFTTSAPGKLHDGAPGPEAPRCRHRQSRALGRSRRRPRCRGRSAEAGRSFGVQGHAVLRGWRPPSSAIASAPAPGRAGRLYCDPPAILPTGAARGSAGSRTGRQYRQVPDTATKSFLARLDTADTDLGAGHAGRACRPSTHTRPAPTPRPAPTAPASEYFSESFLEDHLV